MIVGRAEGGEFANYGVRHGTQYCKFTFDSPKRFSSRQFNYFLSHCFDFMKPVTDKHKRILEILLQGCFGKVTTFRQFLFFQNIVKCF